MASISAAGVPGAGGPRTAAAAALLAVNLSVGGVAAALSRGLGGAGAGDLRLAMSGPSPCIEWSQMRTLRGAVSRKRTGLHRSLADLSKVGAQSAPRDGAGGGGGSWASQKSLAVGGAGTRPAGAALLFNAPLAVHRGRGAGAADSTGSGSGGSSRCSSRASGDKWRLASASRCTSRASTSSSGSARWLPWTEADDDVFPAADGGGRGCQNSLPVPAPSTPTFAERLTAAVLPAASSKARPQLPRPVYSTPKISSSTASTPLLEARCCSPVTPDGVLRTVLAAVREFSEHESAMRVSGLRAADQNGDASQALCARVARLMHEARAAAAPSLSHEQRRQLAAAVRTAAEAFPAELSAAADPGSDLAFCQALAVDLHARCENRGVTGDAAWATMQRNLQVAYAAEAAKAQPKAPSRGPRPVSPTSSVESHVCVVRPKTPTAAAVAASKSAVSSRRGSVLSRPRTPPLVENGGEFDSARSVVSRGSAASSAAQLPAATAMVSTPSLPASRPSSRVSEPVVDAEGVVPTSSSAGLRECADFAEVAAAEALAARTRAWVERSAASSVVGLENDAGSDFAGSDFGGSDFGGSEVGGSEVGGSEVDAVAVRKDGARTAPGRRSVCGSDLESTVAGSSWGGSEGGTGLEWDFEDFDAGGFHGYAQYGAEDASVGLAECRSSVPAAVGRRVEKQLHFAMLEATLETEGAPFLPIAAKGQ